MRCIYWQGVLISLLLIIENFHGFVPCFKGTVPVHRRASIPRQQLVPSPRTSQIGPLHIKVKEAQEVPVDYSKDLAKTVLWFAGSTAFCGILSQFKGVAYMVFGCDDGTFEKVHQDV